MHKNSLDNSSQATAQQGGFTLIEVMVALTVLLIGSTGILSLHMTASRSNAYARHAAEATMLAEDKMEVLRLGTLTEGLSASDVVNARGEVELAGLYARNWTFSNGVITVSITWKEYGSEDHTITFRTSRWQ